MTFRVLIFMGTSLSCFLGAWRALGVTDDERPGMFTPSLRELSPGGEPFPFTTIPVVK
jgi:hypothetical protein